MERLLIVKIHRTATSPAPAGNSTGKTTERIFDSIGRLQKDLITNTGAYTRYEYPDNGVQSKVFSTIIDTNNNNTGDAADEVLSESWFDGAGRLRQARVPHTFNTNGATATWAGTLTEYDILGRVFRQSVPTEISVSGTSWTAAGDDATRGWIWNYSYYDWKGRTVRTVPSDSTGSDGKDTLITYEGCGCAGGQITTVQGPLVPRDDQPTLNARRTQKSYADILGRTHKTETLNWTGSVYSTVKSTFNGRDQATLVRQYDGTDTSTTFQDTTATFDGHGRLSSRHNAIDESGTHTAWTYNADDSVATMTDPRGTVTSYTYGNPNLAEKRPLLIGIAYAPPATQPSYTTIPDTPDVSFSYDAAGNRTAMTDGSGSTSYAYDSLSRLTSETKTLTGLSGNFTLAYGYQILGKLKSITDPFGAVVNYNDDKTARTTSVTGTNFAGVSNYSTGIQYRAFGGIKQMTYGSSDSSTISYGYDNALRVSTYQATSSVQSGGFVRKASYEHFNDGRAKKVSNIIDPGLDQNYKFDSQGRLTSSISGQKLNNESEMEEPFTQAITYNAFGDMTYRANHVWGALTDFAAAYTNGRKTTGNEIYDKSGNVVDKTTSSNIYDRWKFDAAGRNVETVMRWWQAVPAPSIDQTQTIAKTFDGDGLDVKRVDTNVWFHTFPNNDSGTTTKTEYYVRSSVLGGQTVTELDQSGAKKVTHVYTGKGRLAEQRLISGTPGVYWRHEDLVTGSYGKIGVNGQYGGYAEDSPTAVEYDPLGGSIEPDAPQDETLNPAHLMQFKFAGDNNRAEYGCMVDGIMQDGPGACTVHLRNGTADPVTTHRQPFSLGYWRDYVVRSGTRPGPDGEDIDWWINETRFYPFGTSSKFIAYFDFLYLSGTVYVGLRDKKNARDALQALRSSNDGECGKKLDELLNALNSEGEARATNMMDLFDDVQAGLKLNVDSQFYAAAYRELTGRNPMPVAGGGGLTSAILEAGTTSSGGVFMLIGASNSSYTIERGKYFSLDGVSKAEMNKRIRPMRKVMEYLIHELFHAAGKTRTFGHSQLAKASLAVDPKLTDRTGDGSSMLNEFIRKHCTDLISVSP